ncbi:PREDICTED: phosphoribosylformylglycinamidine synthase-like [Wasmannia auropunctata]|uniref:phosphoribosylformylglycinamidine synthase-like n=1 Tax=Wasmannia auropunctata TaxID=64793 RepID=UPI0005EDB149|nr:PREDICTED: phosphoribosylformylglycinamidine synthase-like [Wasmannia auropunctata]
MDEYISGLVSLVQQLADIGHNISDEEVAVLMLGGLPAEFDPLIMGLEATHERLTSDMVKTRLLSEDYRRGSTDASSGNEAAFATNSANKGTFRKREVTCYKCGKKGHIKPKCPQIKKEWKTKDKKDNQDNSSKKKTEDKLLLTSFAVGSFDKDSWFIDSGCTTHMSMRNDWFSKYTNNDTKEVFTANNQKMYSQGTDVMYVPEIATNLLSVSKMAEKGLIIVFDDQKCHVYNKSECQIRGKSNIPAKQDMEVIKIGGPVYRIGVGGGSASSVEVQGDNSMELDFGAVQRGDPEMEQKLNRVVRACAEIGDDNPILSIHDQGAGGNGNVLKELVEPAGAVIFTKKFDLGDPSISTLELWGAEYQESDAILCKPKDSDLLKKIATREKCPINFVGTVTGNGKIIVSEEENCDTSKYLNYEDKNLSSSKHPVNLELEVILGKMPRKVFNLHDMPVQRFPMKLLDGLTVLNALDRVLRLPSVASKRYLTNKVDRCVTGLVAQQQCVGPLHTPLADVAVTAISYFSTKGIATSIGEQPIKGLVNEAAGARMTIIEALSNLVFARISALQDVKCSGNWMWPAKLPGEGAALYKTCSAMCSLMKELGIAIDGGKDSLSMATRINKDIVKAPGTLVISCYAPCPDVYQVITPDLKAPAMGRQGCLLFIDLSYGKNRLGGTALSQVYCQLGNDVPDIENTQAFKNAFNVIQQLIADKKVFAGHDISDGGLITCLLEMCFAGISGVNIDITHKSAPAIDILFSEEVGWILEIDEKYQDEVMKMFQCYEVPVYLIGKSVELGMNSKVIVKVRNEVVLSTTVIDSMSIWEETSYQLERHQTNITCALEEFSRLRERTVPAYRLNFDPVRSHPILKNTLERVRVAVIREEGINGDREMAASLLEAGFDVWDVTMQDLLENQVTLEVFRGVIFPGGFSYADVCGSAKGWAASFLFHPSLREQLRRFVSRENTFSLGVCNGCQLMSLLGWVGDEDTKDRSGVYLDHNLSERFECRWTTVRIENSPSIMLKGMQDSVLGVWVAHGEGRFIFREEVSKTLEQNNCVAIRYVLTF